MEKPKIVSMKDALDMAETESEIPELPGYPIQNSPPPTLPESLPIESPESEHPPEVPPERIGTYVPKQPASFEPAVEPEPVSPSPQTTSFIEPLQATPVVMESEQEPVAPQLPAGSPPWVEREPQTPTVSEAAKPVPTYPGVGRPRINSISQGAVSLEPPKPVTAPIRPAGHWSHHHVHPVHVETAVHIREKRVEPNSPDSTAPGKLYERPELDADRFAEEMASAKETTPVHRDVVKEYREAASKDMLPPSAPPRPLTAEEERARARSLAQQIHQENQQSGLFGKVKRMLGMR